MKRLCAASVAVVKSRDMHWGLLAQKDHKDISFASLRLLLIADGANPCESPTLSSFLPPQWGTAHRHGGLVVKASAS